MTNHITVPPTYANHENKTTQSSFSELYQDLEKKTCVCLEVNLKCNVAWLLASASARSRTLAKAVAVRKWNEVRNFAKTVTWTHI